MEFALVPLDRLVASPDNIRNDVGDIRSLAKSIEERGLLQPILVMPVQDGLYQIVAGHRRRAALESINAAEAECLIAEGMTEADAVVDQLVENLQREDISTTEESAAFSRLNELGLKQKDIARLCGVTQPYVSNRILLQKLPDEVRIAVDAGGLHINDAQELARRLGDQPELLMRVFQNRHQGLVSALIDQALKPAPRQKVGASAEPDAPGSSPGTAESPHASAGEAEPSPSRRNLRKTTEARYAAVESLLRGHRAITKGAFLDFVLTTLINDAVPQQRDQVAQALGIPRRENPNGFGQVYDVDGYLSQNPSENPFRFVVGLALMRGHTALQARVLSDKDRIVAAQTLGLLQSVAAYEPTEAELELAHGATIPSMMRAVPEEDKPTPEEEAGA